MDFTREPIVETIITSKDGCKLVVRNSKGISQEEYFVDAVEVITFGSSTFFRSMERPKSFLVPVSDYEIVEVRDTRMVLKTGNIDKVKIGGGRDGSVKANESSSNKASSKETSLNKSDNKNSGSDVKGERKKDRRKHYRRKRGREDEAKENSDEKDAQLLMQEGNNLEEAHHMQATPPPSIIAPPAGLISDTIGLRRLEGREEFSEISHESTPLLSKPGKRGKEVEGDPSFFQQRNQTQTSSKALEEKLSKTLKEGETSKAADRSGYSKSNSFRRNNSQQSVQSGKSQEASGSEALKLGEKLVEGLNSNWSNSEELADKPSVDGGAHVEEKH